MATNEYRKNQQYTTWHQVVVWGKRAEVQALHLKKGRRVMVEGALQTHAWEDQEGLKHFQVRVRADRVVYQDRRPKDEAPAEADAQTDLPLGDETKRPEVPQF